MPEHGKLGQAQSSGIFLSDESRSRYPKSIAHTLFHTATVQDYAAQAPTEAEGLQENMERVMEIGRRDCKYIKHPGIGPVRTRKSQLYYLSFRPKKPTDLALNNYAAHLKKLSSGGADGPPIKFTSNSTNRLDYTRSTPDVMRRSKPPAVSGESQICLGTGDMMDLDSHGQTVHGKNLIKPDGTLLMDNVPAKVLPVDNLEMIDGRSNALCNSRYRLDYDGGDMITMPKERHRGQSKSWRRTRGLQKD
eukprot:TRINITY_DN24903_c0_g1_i1.p1 TRINITY_DN24903_c0_g1~~TRINITY_DN24903_c0_g1_i1.p1  ORF type:complete len:248 (+),score=33.56 TRINITY_DN24903_c0_g1_i1:72-815(+)